MTTLDTRLDLDLELELLVAVEPSMFLVATGPAGIITAPVPVSLDAGRFWFLNPCHPGQNCATPAILAPGTADKLLIYNGNDPYRFFDLTTIRFRVGDIFHVVLSAGGGGRWLPL